MVKPRPTKAIAVDAMGGDHAPAAVVEGSVQAATELGLEVVLVGNAQAIRAELGRLGASSRPGIRVHHASQVVAMGDDPARSVRARKDASIRVIFDLVKAGEACAAVSAGNSGAMLAAALLVLGRLPEVERPAIITYLPTLLAPVGLLDAGANVDVKPLQLVQFALMGEVWTRRVHGVASPRVGVLSNGEEASKGTALTRRALQALASDERLAFAGPAEAKDLFTGAFDVVATDGFTGNVVLKTAEGTVAAFVEWLRRAVTTSTRAKAGALLLKPALAELKRTLDWAEYGGAPLLGCDGTVVIAHGRSGARAIRNAIRTASAAAAVDARAELSAACARARLLVAGSA